MNVLVGKTFGIGNFVCSIPMIKALCSVGNVTVLTGKTPDDIGAIDVHIRLKNDLNFTDGGADVSWLCDEKRRYDVAVMAIPYDGRWKEGVHFLADKVVDCRPRPEFSKELGFSSWKKHEVEYQMENAYELGYIGKIPDCSFMKPVEKIKRRVYVGMGYKRDTSGFWNQKHWGNENFVELIKKILSSYDDATVVTSGNMTDAVTTMWPIMRKVNDLNRFTVRQTSLFSSFDIINSCDVYVGNDTGMMHVAASTGCKTIGIFKLDNSWTKSSPWCEHAIAIKGYNRNVDVDEVFEHVKEFMK